MGERVKNGKGAFVLNIWCARCSRFKTRGERGANGEGVYALDI